MNAGRIDAASPDDLRSDVGLRAPNGPHRACILCGSTAQVYLFIRHGAAVSRCASCGLARLDPRTDAQAIAGAERASGIRRPLSSLTEQRAAERVLNLLENRGASRSGMLAVVPAGHPFIAAAEARGFTIAARREMHDIERCDIPAGPYESAVVLFQLEKASEPLIALDRIRRALVPGGLLLVLTPSLDSWPARLLRSQWTGWLPENRYYFDAQTLQSTCLRSGFAELRWSEDTPGTPLTRMIGRAAALVPAPWRRALLVQWSASGILMTGRRTEAPRRPLVSVVMPVYNERATFEHTIRAVLEKNCHGVDKEVVIIESGSTDGTRELVRTYEETPGITVIFEDRPRGKGAAVRAGLERARGSIVLIQDADNEYDVNDYDALLEPILTYRRAFVLGSRHTGSWKVRKFADQPAVSAFFNFGHVLFRTALNVLYRQKIQDPFTMYKVFRRDCLHRLKFECNRFDFDFELVIKLLRKGYVPLEIPVNYTSRSFKDGKKVSTFRDPMTWIRALAKYRFASIYTE